MIAYAVVEDLSRDFSLGDSLGVSSAARMPSDSERSVGDDPEVAAKRRVEERELEAPAR